MSDTTAICTPLVLRITDPWLTLNYHRARDACDLVQGATIPGPRAIARSSFACTPTLPKAACSQFTVSGDSTWYSFSCSQSRRAFHLSCTHRTSACSVGPVGWVSKPDSITPGLLALTSMDNHDCTNKHNQQRRTLEATQQSEPS